LRRAASARFAVWESLDEISSLTEFHVIVANSRIGDEFSIGRYVRRIPPIRADDKRDACDEILVSEENFVERFPDCERARCALGNLYDVARLRGAESHTRSRRLPSTRHASRVIKMSFDDFAELVQPDSARFAMA